MRLIDADALMKTLDDLVEARREWRDRYRAEISGLHSAQCAVEDAPTIEERKRGEWIPLGVRYGWICSKCRKENVYAFSSDDNGEYVLQDYFCPNCGADMRGEQDE